MQLEDNQLTIAFQQDEYVSRILRHWFPLYLKFQISNDKSPWGHLIVWFSKRLTQPGAHWVQLSMLLYIAACFLPALPPVFDDKDPIRGWICLMFPMIPFWWANPAYLTALLMYAAGRPGMAIFPSILAVILAVSIEVIGLVNSGVDSLKDLLIGCHLWIASTQVLLCNLIWIKCRDWKNKQEQLDHVRL